MRLFFLPPLAGLLLCATSLWSQSPAPEFRGMWIATVKNIDWPSRAGLPVETQQRELIEILDRLQAHHFNAVVLQVRPAGDAFYDSPFEPWSEWLSGEQGKAPSPYYDPLQFAISECHRRNMELHAWINPFRAVTDDDPLKQLAPNHVARTHPEWTVRYGNNRYIDPGIPMARDYLISIVMDVVQRYDIDAIHFDDYFYPYQIAGEEFPDSLSFRLYRARFTDLIAWRRNNVDEFIHQLHDTLVAVKAEVEFGISPFGVWRNNAEDPLGSATRAGITSYDGLHADVRTWLQRGWIDYVAPQLYFSIGFAPADFTILLDWWERNSFGKHLYIGHSVYKINNNADQNWADPRELPRQIAAVRRNPAANGSIHFSANWLKKNPLGFADSLQNRLYAAYAFPPSMPWLDNVAPLPPAQVSISATKAGMELLWIDPRNPDAAYYCVYRSEGKELPNASQQYLREILRERGQYSLDEEVKFGKKYHYLVTARDRQHNESEPILVSKRYWRGLFRK